jgi:hypothetical protein
MLILALKLLITPLFIAAVSLAGRRWGPGVSGLLTGLPLTSGPVSLLLALQYGPTFAAHAAVGNLCGQASVCIFCLAYSVAARRLRWPASSALALGAFLAATFIWNRFTWTLLPAFAALLIVVVVIVRLIPQPATATAAPRLPRWDLPARMVTAATFVVLLTGSAELLGPQLSGLISPFPVFGNILAAFAHHQAGPPAAMRLLRGIVLGSPAYACFFLVVGALLPRLALGWTYTLAALIALGVNAALFYLV